jgi:hypothetical protein
LRAYRILIRKESARRSLVEKRDWGRRSTILTTLKTAVLAPVPNASVSATTVVNPGFLKKVRQP